MCGRYAEIASADELRFVFELPALIALPPRFNIAPTQPAPVVLIGPDGARRLEMLNWGLVPHWADDTSIAGRMINARSETAAAKPAFRDALRYRRCIVPCSGFYEWQRRGRVPQPCFICRPDRQVFGLAGLWETWLAPDGTEAHTYTILTTTPNADVEPLHDRMPVVLDRADFATWLDPRRQQAEQVAPLLVPAPDGSLLRYPVSTRVNSVANEGPDLIERHDPPQDPQMTLFP